MSKQNLVLRDSLITPEKRYIEIVERKGIGHPDTLADGLAETLSLEYSLFCINNFGGILHHNFDKLYIGGGKVEVDFGIGKLVKPINVFSNGRISKKYGNRKIDYEPVIEEAIRKYIKEVLPLVDVNNGFDIKINATDHSVKPYWFSPRNLNDVPDMKEPVSNDTSVTISYWPLSPIEKVVLSLESFFYKNKKSRFDFIGQDIKIMAIRNGLEADFIVTIPFICTKTPNLNFYKESIIEIQENLSKITQENVSNLYKTKVHLNTERGQYMLLFGSCVELGEEGLVGRGNKTHGIISSLRPWSMEAPFGKNPVYHVGKVHTVIADYLSKEISEKHDCSCSVMILNKIGDELYKPHQIVIETDKPIKEYDARPLVNEALQRNDWTKRILYERLLVPKIGL